jgi:enoyl-CoA hydratase/carnithine racemase
MARKVAALPPIPVRMSKQAINVAAMPVSQSSIYMDRDQFLLTSQTNDQREAVSAFFEKREPDFKGD